MFVAMMAKDMDFLHFVCAHCTVVLVQNGVAHNAVTTRSEHFDIGLMT